jgi:hypothetical protein
METDSRQTSGSETGAPGFEDLKKLIEKFQLPSVDIDVLIDWQRRDMEALTEANRQASEGLKALVERRNEILRETLEQILIKLNRILRRRSNWRIRLA